jgi:hypothetical protein
LDVYVVASVFEYTPTPQNQWRAGAPLPRQICRT